MSQEHALSWPETAVTSPKYADDETQALIARCLHGDESAYATLYQLFAGMIYRLCFGLLQHREDAEEVVQDSFEYAFRSLSKYNPHKSAFKTWLYQIAISRCRNKRRRKWLPTLSLGQQIHDHLSDPDGVLPGELVMLDERQQVVWAALKELSPKLRETAVLRYYDGLSFAEIGEVLGIPPKTAESRMRLAHKSLRAALADVDI